MIFFDLVDVESVTAWREMYFAVRYLDEILQKVRILWIEMVVENRYTPDLCYLSMGFSYF